MRQRMAVAVLGAVALTASLAACSKNTGTDTSAQTKHKPQTSSIAMDPKDSMGPAKAVPGAVRGGTFHYLEESDFEHLDPQRNYVVDAMSMDQLYIRTLTMFKETGDGTLTLVGDLATTPGKDVKGDCTQWRFTLKDGLKYEDGSPITAADVAYGVARSFSPTLGEGPTYIQRWLADSDEYNAKYKGPYDGGAKMPPGVTVDGAKTITFTFAKPQCDLPFAASLGTTAPVPPSKDTGTKYDRRPFASGPYKIDKYIRGTSLTLVRNKYWDPKTDAVRHDYFDKLVAEFGPDDVQQTNRVIASNGDDAYATQYENVPASLLPKVTGDPAVKKRMVQGLSPFVSYLAINTQRVTDLNVRKALNYALDRGAYLQARGGNLTGQAATALESPLTIGYQKYDAYPSGTHGDAAKAKQLLGGKHPKLVYAYSNVSANQATAVVIKNSLEKAGFQIVLKPVDSSNYYDNIGTKTNPYDLYINTWAADWPSGSSILAPLFNGNTIRAKGNKDYSYLNAPDVNAQIEKLVAEHAEQAAPEWAKLDKMIMTKYAPVVPIINTSNVTLSGTKCKNVVLSQTLGTPIFYNVYLTT
ncbi:ABC transporter substrate-binding protein [Actinocatenispora sera]|uniref:ABC transporter substrate-binding protein n=1 Tax=Actinocatenispora sera TaxID=390989 RepID=UPI0033E6C5FE